MSSAGYGTPPFPPYSYDTSSPDRATWQAPPQDFTEDSGEFTIMQTFPPWTEAGHTLRAIVQFAHDKDGSIQPAGVALAILDGTGAAAAGFTVGAVAQDPSGSNRYYSVVQVGATVASGNYVLKWTGSYTPLAAGSVSETIQSRQQIRVKVTKAPSQYYFLDTAKA